MNNTSTLDGFKAYLRKSGVDEYDESALEEVLAKAKVENGQLAAPPPKPVEAPMTSATSELVGGLLSELRASQTLCKAAVERAAQSENKTNALELVVANLIGETKALVDEMKTMKKSSDDAINRLEAIPWSEALMLLKTVAVKEAAITVSPAAIHNQIDFGELAKAMMLIAKAIKEKDATITVQPAELSFPAPREIDEVVRVPKHDPNTGRITETREKYSYKE
jgi:hypothetical protein